MRWTGRALRLKKKQNLYRILVRKPSGKGPVGRPRRGWEDDIKLYIEEILSGDMNWIYLAQDMDQWSILVNSIMK
jgi:hypothetical protein